MTSLPTYDLVLMLDPAVDEDVRTAIVGDVEKAIRTDGELLRHDPWGQRPLSFQIDHKGEADYHLFQLHGPPSMLRELDRTLRITDGVIRFRIIKLKPGTPPPPEMRAQRRPETVPAAAAAAAGAPAAAVAPAATEPEPEPEPAVAEPAEPATAPAA